MFVIFFTMRGPFKQCLIRIAHIADAIIIIVTVFIIAFLFASFAFNRHDIFHLIYVSNIFRALILKSIDEGCAGNNAITKFSMCLTRNQSY